MLAETKLMPHRHFTLEEYFALERAGVGRYEFWDGEILCMRSQQALEPLAQQVGDLNSGGTMFGNLKDVPSRHYTLEEYFALEQSGEGRYEYWDGEIVCMSGGTRQHARIGYNLTLLLGAQLKGCKCDGHTADQPIKTPLWPPYRYPDASVSCNEPQFERMNGIDVLLNPTLVVEVLSAGTEMGDFGKKKEAYQALPSLQQYLLVSQKEPQLILFTRLGDTWQRHDVANLQSSIKLVSINCELTLHDIYEGVEFE